jgi:uncharacterized protein involved in copper resistance
VPNPAQTPLTRRHVLAGAAGIALLLTGCTTGAPRAPEPAPRDPLAALMDEHAALAAAYSEAITAAPTDPRLPGLAGNVAQHITALAGALAVAPPSAGAEPTASPSATEATDHAPDPAALVSGIRDGESALAARCRELALSQNSVRAPLLASLAAAHGCAAAVLG